MAEELRRFGLAPTLAEIEEMAHRIFAQLPKAFTARCQGLAIRVLDFAEDETLSEMGIESPFDLAGLYRGAPLTVKGAGDFAKALDLVFLYRRPLIDWWAEDEVGFEDLVRHVLIHEIGHHFGFSDADMERIEASDED
ncbi:MAG TPA: metallopeptidase family protein [Candidatus Cybelea sp.]|nr:metallopeptidase family protein [Candidatus Cybelea sp.]